MVLEKNYFDTTVVITKNERKCIIKYAKRHNWLCYILEKIELVKFCKIEEYLIMHRSIIEYAWSIIHFLCPLPWVLGSKGHFWKQQFHYLPFHVIFGEKMKSVGPSIFNHFHYDFHSYVMRESATFCLFPSPPHFCSQHANNFSGDHLQET